MQLSETLTPFFLLLHFTDDANAREDGTKTAYHHFFRFLGERLKRASLRSGLKIEGEEPKRRTKPLVG
jgi:hypothetical protein